MARITTLKSDKVELSKSSSMSYSVKQNNPRNIYNLYTSEFSSITPDLIKFYLESARKGLNFWKSLFFDEIRRRDLHIAAVCQTRKLSVAKNKYEIVCEDQKMKEFAEITLDNFNTTNFISDIVEASVQGVSVFEINYDYYPGIGILPESVTLIPNHLILYDENVAEYKIIDILKADGFQLRAIASNSIQDTIDVTQIPQIDIDPNKLIEVHSFDGNSQNGFLNGCIDSLIWAYLFKSYSTKDWATYLERYAMPLRTGKYDSMMGDKDKNSLIDAVKNIGNNSYAVFPNTAEINFLTDSSKGNSSQLFSNFISYWNEQISIRVLGQTLTTKMEGSGSYAAARVHENVKKDILLSDMRLTEDTVNELLARVIDLNFPDVSEYPIYKFTESEDMEYMQNKANIYKTLKDTGVIVNPEFIAEEFNIELAEEKKTPKEFSEKEADDEIDQVIKEIWDSVNE